MFKPTDKPSETPTDLAVDSAAPHDDRTFCAVHPTVETSLRCNKCGRYMCVKCAVRTPVGYRCKECIHQQQDVFYSATQRDYVIAAAVSFGLAIPAAFLARLGFLIIIITALPIGGAISEVVFRAIGKRRGRYIWIAAAGGMATAILLIAASEILPILTDTRYSRISSGDVLLILLPSIIFLALCVGAAIARLRYGK